MAGYNRVILMGNLTRDPEVRETPSGVKVADLRLAVSESYRSRQDNERKEITCFVDIVVWDRQAELCGEYLSKGRPILVEGRLQLDEWKSAQGEARSRLRVRADRVHFLGSAQGRREYVDGPDDAAVSRTEPAASPVGGGSPEAVPAASPVGGGSPEAVPAAPDVSGETPRASEDEDDLPF